MDSINRQQAEDSHKNLNNAEAAKKIKELGEKAKTCFFCTNIVTGQSVKVRPMSVQKIDNQGVCWFLSASDSHKNAELIQDSHMQLLFQGSTHSDFLSLYGKGEISRDKDKIKELWEPIIKNWFTEGEDDPRITVIKFTPEEGYYWDNKYGDLVSFIKIATGAIIGKTMDDSVEGKISVF